MATDSARWSIRWQLRKYREDVTAWLASGRTSEEFHRLHTPYEVREIDGNLLVNVGIQLLEDLLIVAGGTGFNNAKAYIGVGDDNTAATTGDTDLNAATNKLRKAMNASYPQRTGQQVDWQSDFGDSEANWAWEEWAIFNASTAGTMLNHKVESLGTKASGTWTLTGSVTIS